MKVTLENEIQLLEALAKGDEAAFAELYYFFQPVLHTFIFPLTGFSKDETEEILQDIFLKLWLRKETMVIVKSLKPYLFRMAKNRLLDKRRRDAQVTGAIAGWQSAQPGTETGDAIREKMQLEEYHELARNAIKRLTPQKRRILLLRNEHGRSLDEIAAELSMTKFAVKKHLYEAVKTLRDQLQHYNGIDIPIAILIIIHL
ncbi:RNA polymerase sigma factor [Chitinophaga cymbidii]|uniref:DNA-directed RNA polymerase sigma-70 factor n=1 Tax=Chitinophaga cymbidii TaxID=1096750 RepID=A0A512RPM8_9BACT|nr:sigma-70 family RNA polymerase sigma factor [Chitinophaga cymbidii]GEP97653.1 DNA-directed RNA polymerase sigma-70 factor [Chitinophaga cymbidii]